MKRALAVAAALGILATRGSAALPRLHASESEGAPAPQAVMLKAYPALVYVEDDLPGPASRRSRLSVASFGADPPTTLTVLQSQSVYAQRLSDPAFLLEASEQPADRVRWTQTFYLADFGSGKVRFLSHSVSRDRLVHFGIVRIASRAWAGHH